MAPSKRVNSERTKVDPITLSVIRGGIASLCAEMGQVVERASYSPIITDGLDYSCSLFDGGGEEVAMHAFDPNHLACMKFAVEWSLNEVGFENLHPGDVVFCNDPYRGGNHINDCTLFRPVFHKGKLVGIPAIRPHLIDLGGAAPGNIVGDATEIFQEGLRIPPVKLYTEGKRVDDMYKLILANTRDPRGVLGDMDAMIGACNMAERRVHQFVDKYGEETWNDCLTEVKNVSERFMRHAIDEIPEGRYEAEDWLDDDGTSSEPLKIKVAITIKGDTLIADYEGSSRQAIGPINATYAVTAGNTCIGVLDSIGIKGDVLVNEGCFRPVKVLAPPGSVVNVDYPGPCMIGNMETAPRIGDLVVAALGQAVPKERTKAACHGTNYPQSLGGVHPKTGEMWIQLNYGGGGQGARFAKDGNNGTIEFGTNNKGQSIEILETTFPIRYDEFSLLNDSGGPGKFRGGLGITYLWYLTSSDCILSSEGDRNRFSPFGVYGGLPPKPLPCGHASCTKVRIGDKGFEHAMQISAATSPSKWANIHIKRGDALETIITGGGGFGEPFDRDPEMVLRDVVNDYVTVESARTQYRVVIDQAQMKIDRRATARLREQL